MARHRHADEPASEATASEPASAVPSPVTPAATPEIAPPASAPVPEEHTEAIIGSGTPTDGKKRVVTIKSGGRKVLATAHIHRASGYVRAGQEFVLESDKEAARLAGCFTEI
jgi:hypothetical protein